jgi:hypothetical protein
VVVLHHTSPPSNHSHPESYFHFGSVSSLFVYQTPIRRALDCTMVHLSNADITHEISRRTPARSSADFCLFAAEEIEPIHRR